MMNVENEEGNNNERMGLLQGIYFCNILVVILMVGM